MFLIRSKNARALVTLLFIVCSCRVGLAQCSSPIQTYPYQESFEVNDGGWFDGGVASDWTWGTPSRSVISAAGEGNRCWVAGGLTGSGYNDSESSWLQSPCFDFSSLENPIITFKVFWETERKFDGAALQYSLDGGGNWVDVGSANEAPHCLNSNWYNQSSINYLGALSASRHGWSGNIQASAGSCQGGGGSGTWVTASHLLSELAGEPSVIFRFIFGSGSICNTFDGFAIDAISISEAPGITAAFDYACAGERSVQFTDNSTLCPTSFSWDFGDPASGAANQSNEVNPHHEFSAPGTYLVSLTVTSPGSAPSTTTREVTILSVNINRLLPADCNTNSGGSLEAVVEGGTGNYQYTWNTQPVQTSKIAVNLTSGIYTVEVTADGACGASAKDTVLVDRSCMGVYFPTAFTPNGDGKNEGFGPLGSIALLQNYQLSIYNRWGERVFHSTSPLQQWDGRHRGENQPTALFTWYARYDLPGEKNVLRKGTILLVR